MQPANSKLSVECGAKPNTSPVAMFSASCVAEVCNCNWIVAYSFVLIVCSEGSDVFRLEAATAGGMRIVSDSLFFYEKNFGCLGARRRGIELLWLKDTGTSGGVRTSSA